MAAEGPALIWAGQALACRPAGYAGPVALPGEVEVLTPAPMRAVLAAGYRPVLHPSAGAVAA